MITTEEWIEEKIRAYNENPKEALEEMFTTTNDVIEQYLNNPNSVACSELIITCCKHNKLFFEKSGIVDKI